MEFVLQVYMEVTVLQLLVSGPMWFIGEASSYPKDFH